MATSSSDQASGGMDFDRSSWIEAERGAPYLLGRAYAIREAIVRLAAGERLEQASGYQRDAELPQREFEQALWRPQESERSLGQRMPRALTRARERSPQQTAELEEMLTRIMAEVGVAPARLNPEEGASWTAGYYGQIGAFTKHALALARQTQEEAVALAKQAAADLVTLGGYSEHQAARIIGLDRMTVRRALGK